MPRGPGGEKRPADVVGAAIMVARLSVGDLHETPDPPSGRVRSGRVGGTARARQLSASERQEIARKGAQKRWVSGDV